MLMCGIPRPAAPGTPDDPYALAERILVPLGEYFQVQDDFLDYAMPPELLGKVGTDIIDNKCSWCVNTALALATPAQRAVLDANYGRKDAQAEARVKALYEEMGIKPPKGVILYGVPGTGKTLLAKAVANQTSATFLRIVGSELIQKYLGDGPKLVRELFRAAEEHAPSIVFIDEIDAVGTKR